MLLLDEQSTIPQIKLTEEVACLVVHPSLDVERVLEEARIRRRLQKRELQLLLNLWNGGDLERHYITGEGCVLIQVGDPEALPLPVSFAFLRS